MCFFFQAEDGIRDLVRSRGLGDVYKRQALFQGGGGANGKRAKRGFAGKQGEVAAQRGGPPLSLIHI